MALKLLRLPAVEERTGESVTGIYGGMWEGTFPKPVPLGKRTVAWVEEEIEEWIRKRIAARDAQAEQPPQRKGGPGRGRKGPVPIAAGVAG